MLAALTASLEEEGKSVRLCWIPAHVGIVGNELADAAARRAASRVSTRRILLPASDFNPAVSAFVHRMWQEAWQGQSSNKLRALKPTLELWPSSSRRSRLEEVILCRLRIGHTYATHGHLLRGDERPSCPQCRVPLTVAHILVVCPRLSAIRVRYLGLIPPNEPLGHILGDKSSSVHSGSLFLFIRDIPFPVIYSPH